MSLRIPYDTVKDTVKTAFLNLGLSEEQAEVCSAIHTPVSYTHLDRSAAGRNHVRQPGIH